jgi:quinol monooxygenase YgiN
MKHNQLPIIVKFEVKKDKIDFMKKELLKIVELTRKEEGCIQYDLHQDKEDQSVFMFYEIWETVEAWQKHDLQQHIINFKTITKDAIEKISFNKLSLIS